MISFDVIFKYVFHGIEQDTKYLEREEKISYRFSFDFANCTCYASFEVDWV